MAGPTLAVIGGSGLSAIEGLTGASEQQLDTPFGATSGPIVVGALEGTEIAFLPRHGPGHRLLPAEIPARANFWALKSLGVERVIAISAVGSLKEAIEPLHAVVPDQLIDRTRGRVSTFFGAGLVAHVGFAQPFCPQLSDTLLSSARSAGVTVHEGGDYVVIEGPAFSTRRESELYRSWGASIIGMTALPEAKLAREAELCYAILAFVTDYDCWREGTESVTADMIFRNLESNAAVARTAIASAVASVDEQRRCECGSALATALVTSPDIVPEKTKARLRPIVGRYFD